MARSYTMLPTAPTTPPPALAFKFLATVTRVVHRCAADTEKPPKRARACRRCDGAGAFEFEFGSLPCRCLAERAKAMSTTRDRDHTTAVAMMLAQAVSSVALELSAFTAKLTIASFTGRAEPLGELSLIGARVLSVIVDEMRASGLSVPSSVTTAIEQTHAEAVADYECASAALRRQTRAAS